MNKYDVLLIIFLVLFSLSFFFIFKDSDGTKEAIVYFSNKEILRVDLNKNAEYVVDGAAGEVVIEVIENKIRVKKETSPNNICSKMGFISASYETLVCLPNKIVIKISAVDELDAIVN